MASPLADLLAGLARAIDSLQARWYLFGAQAAIIYGTPRLTADVDVTVDLGARSISELVESLRREGFTLRVGDADGFVFWRLGTHFNIGFEGRVSRAEIPRPE